MTCTFCSFCPGVVTILNVVINLFSFPFPFFFFFGLFGAVPAAYGSSWAGVKSELQLPAYATATAIPDPTRSATDAAVCGSAPLSKVSGIEPTCSWILVEFFFFLIIIFSF